MNKESHIRAVEPRTFMHWLEKQTARGMKFPTRRGQVVLQRAKIRGGNLDNPSHLSIEGAEIREIERDGITPMLQAEVFFSVELISFEMTPLDKTRTEITTECTSDLQSIQDYYAELLAEIDRRWKAEDAQSVPEPTAKQGDLPIIETLPKGKNRDPKYDKAAESIKSGKVKLKTTTDAWQWFRKEHGIDDDKSLRDSFIRAMRVREIGFTKPPPHKPPNWR